MTETANDESTMNSKGPVKSLLDQLLAIPEMDVRGKKKDYPSINDYYKAASRGNEKPVQYQHGLSNYSSVQLGDDRVSFKKSLSQDAYRLDRAQTKKMLVSTISDNKTFKQRKDDYAEANQVVGLDKIHEMEQMMRDKLQQRTKTGPFQLRKTFKYFDRDGSGGIDFSEFQRAMELMGFQFTEIQQLALFARYDESCTGEVDYNDFVEKVMESDFNVIHTSLKKNLDDMISSTFSSSDRVCNSVFIDEDDSDIDEDELDEYRRREVKKLFVLVDKDGSGYIDRSEVESLLSHLGRDVDKSAIDLGFDKIDSDKSNTIDFNEFYEWFLHK